MTEFSERSFLNSGNASFAHRVRLSCRRRLDVMWISSWTRFPFNTSVRPWHTFTMKPRGHFLKSSRALVDLTSCTSACVYSSSMPLDFSSSSSSFPIPVTILSSTQCRRRWFGGMNPSSQSQHSTTGFVIESVLIKAKPAFREENFITRSVVSSACRPSKTRPGCRLASTLRWICKSR